MKNDSFLFPFEMFGDSLFDFDNDGKLSGLETSFRDAAILVTLDSLINDEEGVEDEEDNDFE